MVWRRNGWLGGLIAMFRLFKEQEAFEEKYGTTLMRLPSPKAVEES